MKSGKVYLVGAGCGAADLITLRGANLLRCCEAVVYDDLIDPQLLELVPSSAEKVYMGKRYGAHSAPQAEITTRLIELANAGRTVVRLKGGDPYVFGRGGEEMEALLKAGIYCEEVPGISSAIAIPAEAGIPVTHRGVSQSFHVVTAHTADTADGLPEAMGELAVLPGTLVFLMGLRQLPRLAERLMAEGKEGSTPVAVISGGNSPHAAVVRGTLADIAEKAAHVQSPAVIVVGAVAEMDLKDGRNLRPLEGIVVGITGTDTMAEKLRSGLTRLGAHTVTAARSIVQELPVSLDFLFEKGRCWVVFTSSNGVRIFFKKLREQGIDMRRLMHISFAVIGPATAATLAEYGIMADLCPPIATTQALGQELIESVLFGDVYLLRSVKGDPELCEAVGRWLTVEDVALYDIVPDLESAHLAKGYLQEMNYLVFSSAGGVKLYFELHGSVPEQTTCVCIGPVAAKELRKHSDAPFLTAEEISAEGIVNTILRHHTEMHI